MKSIGLLIGIISLSCSSYLIGAAKAPLHSESKLDQTPNILLIVADDLGKEWVSCYGAQSIKTPNLDRLAMEGMMFHNAYVNPQCTPTRLSLMTGQYPFRHGWVNHWDVPRWGGGCHYDSEKNPSLAKILKNGGYTTGAAGKWQVNDFRDQPDVMMQHGFDEYLMWTGYEKDNPPSKERYWNPYLHGKGGSKTYPKEFGPDVFVNFASDFIYQNMGTPWFFYYAMCLPHTPFTTTPLDMEAKTEVAQYGAMISYMDDALDRLLSALEETGQRENTIIVWLSDNGSTQKMAGNLNGRKVKGGKIKTTENGICVPFIINSPYIVPEKETDALVDVTDLLPTLTELAGAKLPNEYIFDGRSFCKLLLGEKEDSERSWIMAMGGGNKAKLTSKGVKNQFEYRDRVLRNKRFKLYIGTNGLPEKLIDLWHDQDENINLLDSSDPVVMNAKQQLINAVSQFPSLDNNPLYGFFEKGV